MSDTDTLVGSPTQEHADDDDDDDTGVTSKLLKHAPPTGVDVGEGAEGLRRHEGQQWGFWDLMKYKPVRIMCTTMLFNS